MAEVEVGLSVIVYEYARIVPINERTVYRQVGKRSLRLIRHSDPDAPRLVAFVLEIVVQVVRAVSIGDVGCPGVVDTPTAPIGAEDSLV